MVKKLRAKLDWQRKSTDILSEKLQLDKDKASCQEQKKLEKIIDEHNKRLNFHENPHVPPSKQNYQFLDKLRQM